MEINDTVSALLVVALAIGVYFLPSIVAAKRRHRQYDEIVLFNFFVGWMPIIWFALLAISFVGEAKKRRRKHLDYC